MSRYVGGGGPYAVAHRGGAGLGRENVLDTFTRSFDLGVEYLETDVRITADGVLLAFHDASLGRITGAEGKVSDLTLEGVRRLGIGGELIPRIEDLLDALPDARFVIDLKDSRALAPMINLLRRRGDLDRVALAGARDRWLSAARTMAGGAITTALGWESTARLVMGARAGILPRGLSRAEFVHVPWRLGRAPVFSERLVQMAHHLGLKVMVWTVDDPGTMHHLLDRGADGIITDRPDLLRDVLAGREKWRATLSTFVPVPRRREQAVVSELRVPQPQPERAPEPTPVPERVSKSVSSNEPVSVA